jgi:hypothetical protein
MKTLYKKCFSTGISQEIVTGSGMIDVTPIQALNHKLSWEAEVFTNPQGFFIDIFGGKVFCYATIVRIGELGSVDLVIEKIVYVDIVNITLNRLEIDVLRFLL